LGFQSQLVDGVLTRFALVQWRGLLPDDTSWEKWDDFCRTYNLEDKVDFDGGSIDVLQPKSKNPLSIIPSQDPMMGTTHSHIPTHAKRQVRPPKMLEDYVTILAASKKDLEKDEVLSYR
jgi:hypothetical protein